MVAEGTCRGISQRIPWRQVSNRSDQNFEAEKTRNLQGTIISSCVLLYDSWGGTWHRYAHGFHLGVLMLAMETVCLLNTCALHIYISLTFKQKYIKKPQPVLPTAYKHHQGRP